MPTTSKPAKYSWLGGDLLPTELSSGVVAMGARSYVPEIGRFLQPDSLPGGSANLYAYTDGNPVNETDLTGMFVEGAYLYAYNNEENQRSLEREAARQQAAREEAERKAAEAAAIAALETKEAAEQAEIYAQDRWDAEAQQFGEEHTPGGGMEDEGGRSGGGRFAGSEDPGVPPGYICNALPRSKWGSKKSYCEKYLKEEADESESGPGDAFEGLFCVGAVALDPWPLGAGVCGPEIAGHLHKN